MIKSHLFRGLAVMVTSQVLGIAMSFLFNAIVARNVSTEIYGQFSLVLSVVSIAVIISNFGFLYSMPIVLASVTEKSSIGPYIGACLIIAIFSGILVFFLFILCYFFLSVFNQNTFTNLIFIIPIIFFAPFKDVLLQMGKGLNNLLLLVVVRGGIPATMLIILLLLLLTIELNVPLLLTAQYGSIALIGIFTFLFLKPKFEDSFKVLKQIVKKNKHYGSKVYIAHLFASTWPELIILILSFFSNMTDVAHYRVSLLLVSPLIIITQNIATYYYKGFQKSKIISTKIVYLNLLAVIIQFIIYVGIIKIFVLFFFGSSYYTALPLIYLMSVGASIAGLYQIFDSFMNVQGQGKSILISALAMGLTAIICAIVLIPIVGGQGAAYAYLLGNLVYFVLITLKYRMYIRKINGNEVNEAD